MSEIGEEVEVVIFGQRYPIRADADSDYIRKVASLVDQRMQELNSLLGQSSSTTKVAILTALNLADELERLKERHRDQLAEYDKRIKQYSETLDKSLNGNDTV